MPIVIDDDNTSDIILPIVIDDDKTLDITLPIVIDDDNKSEITLPVITLDPKIDKDDDDINPPDKSRNQNLTPDPVPYPPDPIPPSFPGPVPPIPVPPVFPDSNDPNIHYIAGGPIGVHWIVYAVLMGITGTYFVSKSLGSMFNKSMKANEQYTDNMSGLKEDRHQESSRKISLTNALTHYHRWLPAKPALAILYTYFMHIT